MKYVTLISVDKIKDTDTGGQQTYVRRLYILRI